MFESPFFNQFEWHHASTSSKTKGIFREQELNEVQGLVKSKSRKRHRQESAEPESSSESSEDEPMEDYDNGDSENNDEEAGSDEDELEYTEKRVKDRKAKGQDDHVEYVGLLSQGVFNESGELTADVFSQAMAEKGLDIKRRQPELREKATEKKMRRVGFNPERNFDIYNAGLEILPRNLCRPRVYRDSEKLRAIYSSPERMAKLSPRVQKIITRTNYKLPCSLDYCRYDDDWIVKGLRPRSAQVMANLLYISISRGEDERAWSILTCLIREPSIKVRSLWLIALELLHWKESVNPTGEEPLDERFLDWLIINFPSKHYRPTRWRMQPRAGDAIPFLTIAKLLRGATKDAFEQIDDALTHVPYSSDPVCWALCGVASLRLQGKDSRGSKKTRRYFTRCRELGGIVPGFLEKQAVSTGDSDSDADSEDVAGSDVEQPKETRTGEMIPGESKETSPDGPPKPASARSTTGHTEADTHEFSDIDTERRDSESDTDA